MTIIVPNASEQDVAPRLLDLARSERDVVPRVRREERAGLGHAQPDEEPERGGGAEASHDVDLPARHPQIAEVGRDRLGVPPKHEPDADERDERARLGDREDVLDDLAPLEAAGVRPGQERNQQDADRLRRGERNGVAARHVNGRHG
jgi:hypothetical protein